MRYTYILLVMVVVGCSPVVYKAKKPQSPPILKELPTEKIPVAKEIENPKGVLTLKEALRLALLQNPRLSVFSLEIRAREARTVQSSLLPNPAISIETENFAGSGNFNGLDAAETTVSLNQKIETAGKREKRIRVAALQSDLAYWEYESVRLDVFADVVAYYTAVLAAQEHVAIQKEVLAITKDFKRKIEQRVKAGRLSMAEAMRADVLMNNARIRLTTLIRELREARYRLASSWNGAKPVFTEARGSLAHTVSLPDKDTLLQLLRNNPRLARWDSELESRRARKGLAEANAFPDPVVSGALRFFNESGDKAFVAGVSFDLPFFNRNQGTIQEARVRVDQAVWQKRSILNQLTARLNSLVIKLKRLKDEKKSVENEIIPKSEATLKIISIGFEQGKFQFLDVMNAQQTLFAARERLLDARLELYRTATRIESLIGKKL